jgi:AbrB family looped-hinge helix DNA binding protein
MRMVNVSSKGQIVIPAKIRKRLGIAKSDRLILEEKKEGILLKPFTKLSTFRGAFPIEGGSASIRRMRLEDEHLREKELGGGSTRKKPVMR